MKAAEFLCSFHSGKDIEGAWEADLEYVNWQWWLAQTEDGAWEIVSWGY